MFTVDVKQQHNNNNLLSKRKTDFHELLASAHANTYMYIQNVKVVICGKYINLNKITKI